MKNEITINVRNFPVLAHDHRTGKEEAITVPITREQLRSAQTIGQSSTELIERLCDRQGYTVVEIGRPDKLMIPVDLDTLAKMSQGLCATAGIKSFLETYGVTDREDREYFVTLQADGSITLDYSDGAGGGTNLDFSKRGCDPFAK